MILLKNLKNPSNVFIKNRYRIDSKGKFLFFLMFSFLYIFSITCKANDSLGVKLDNIVLFECGKAIPDASERNYTNFFKPEARFIYIELNLINLKYNISNQELNIIFIWKYFNDEEFGRVEATFNIKSEWETAYIYRGWGWPEKRNWALGRYTAQIFINGELFSEKDFFINLDENEFLTFPQKNQEIEFLKNLPKDINYQIIQQYQIDPYFNSFYDIEFSQDGKDIAYYLSQFEQTEMSQYKTTTRNVYLFRNNKQLIPVYFRIDAFFDNNLKNLAYLGIKTTKTTYNDVYGYFNGKQLFKSIFMPAFYISPDNKKNSFIWNSMPILKSSFTWDAAYEYLMINNQKVQPEWLTNAKTINITQPLGYKKNQNNSYNVVYTAKYKFDNQAYFALFNETKRISDEFDGDIGKPYVSPDEKKVAYIVKNNKEWYVMINNKQITKGYNKIKDEIIFCESGNTIIYQAKIDRDWYVMKGDEKISEGFSKIKSITLSPDENKIAYKCKSNKKWNVYINKNKISPEFEYIGEEICFSPDGNKIAYAAGTKDSMFVMVNNQQISVNFTIFHQYTAYLGKGPLAISNLIFNKAGDKIAYLVNFSFAKGDLISHNEQYYVMINNIQISPKMYSVSLFSKKSGEFTYAGIDISTLVLHHVKLKF